MKLILVSHRRQTPVHISPVKFTTIVGLIMLVFGAGLLYAGYQFGLFIWKDDIAKQRQALAEISQSTEQGLNALTARMGQLQSHMIRLDALGQRLTEQANLDNGEFDFQDPPAQGGPEIPAVVQQMDVPDLLASMEQLGKRIDDRAQQLNVLESLMMNRHLQKQVRPSGRPVKSGWISSYFGRRVDPFTGRMSFHPGIDFAGKKGSAVLAVASGVVVYSGKRYGYGNLVQINHGNGYATRYGHCMKLLVKVGDKVKKGQEIALMGSTGRSTGPHVHFEVLHNGRAVNPARYVQASR